jgi:hypothetical protein
MNALKVNKIFRYTFIIVSILIVNTKAQFSGTYPIDQVRAGFQLSYRNIKKDAAFSAPVDSVILFRFNYSNNGILEKLKQTYNNNLTDFNYTHVLEETWDSTTNSWKTDGQIVRTFDSNNNMIEDLRQNWVDGDWLNYDKYKYTYDSDNRLISWQLYDWILGFWGKGAKETYSYNSNNDVILLEGVNGGYNVWHDTLIYDSNNNLSVHLRKSWSDDQWVNDWRETYTYNSNNKLTLVLEENYDTTSNTWENYHRSKLTYDSNNKLLLLEIDKWNSSGEWEPYQRTNYEYNSNHDLIHARHEIFLDGSWKLRNGYFDVFEDTPDNKNSFPFKYRGFSPTIAEIFIHYNGVTAIREKSILKNLNLEQNYPNPFNPVTTIKFSIPKQEQIVLKVYDLLGEEVATLVNEVRQAGSYNVSFDGSDLPSGVYVYELETGQKIQSKKMILLK